MKTHSPRPSSSSSAHAPTSSSTSSASSGTSNAHAATAVAEEAAKSSGTSLPHLAALEQAFGGHDLSGVQAHHDPEACTQVGAQAFTFGEHIIFGDTPDLGLMAEEAAHVVQQRQGTAPSGQSQAGDASETAATEIAQRVATGQSAGDLLGPQVATAGVESSVQRREKKVSGKAMGRLSSASAGIAHTKKVLSHGAGNQLEALQASSFNSYFRMTAMRDPECWDLDPELVSLARQYPDALTAAKAQLAKGGNCGEHAMVAFDYLRRSGAGIVNRADKTGLDHAFVVLGDGKADADSELVICDPWPTGPTACLWEDHFAYTANRDELNLRNTASADDTDDVAGAISKGLRLTSKGLGMVEYSFGEDRTKEEIGKGTEGDHPWIWQHENAASREYDYFTDEEVKAEVVAAPVVEEAPVAATTTATTTGRGTTATGRASSTSSSSTSRGSTATSRASSSGSSSRFPTRRSTTRGGSSSGRR